MPLSLDPFSASYEYSETSPPPVYTRFPSLSFQLGTTGNIMDAGLKLQQAAQLMREAAEEIDGAGMSLVKAGEHQEAQRQSLAEEEEARRKAEQFERSVEEAMERPMFKVAFLILLILFIILLMTVAAREISNNSVSGKVGPYDLDGLSVGGYDHISTSCNASSLVCEAEAYHSFVKEV